ncbi:hypothetical protein E2C01_018485 [Portunus trituberculatus]|uniref:Uncharacterized protein n=1 Tax=Portunus trituberculatus TaxID=210409 RepID=A0A5B7DWL0_PORTR|nr:hypothetical protein [Portunus trituberculatus]
MRHEDEDIHRHRRITCPSLVRGQRERGEGGSRQRGSKGSLSDTLSVREGTSREIYVQCPFLLKTGASSHSIEKT